MAYARTNGLAVTCCRNHISRCCLVLCRTNDGKAFQRLNILDGHSRECPAIGVKRKLNAVNVIDAQTDLFILRGATRLIRSYNGPEFIAQAVRDRVAAVDAQTAKTEPLRPWENGYCERFNGRFKDELINDEVFYSRRETQFLIDQ